MASLPQPAAPGPRRGARERALAWLYAGPLGHLWSVVADVASLWARYAVARARARVTRARSRAQLSIAE